MCVSNVVTFPKTSSAQQVRVAPILRPEGCASVLHSVEGLALVMLCQCRPSSRRLAVTLLREVRQLMPLLCAGEVICLFLMVSRSLKYLVQIMPSISRTVRNLSSMC